MIFKQFQIISQWFKEILRTQSPEKLEAQVNFIIFCIRYVQLLIYDLWTDLHIIIKCFLLIIFLFMRTILCVSVRFGVPQTSKNRFTPWHMIINSYIYIRKVRRAYENSWDSRCRMFFCCSLASNRKIKVATIWNNQ